MLTRVAEQSDIWKPMEGRPQRRDCHSVYGGAGRCQRNNRQNDRTSALAGERGVKASVIPNSVLWSPTLSYRTQSRRPLPGMAVRDLLVGPKTEFSWFLGVGNGASAMEIIGGRALLALEIQALTSFGHQRYVPKIPCAVGCRWASVRILKHRRIGAASECPGRPPGPRSGSPWEVRAHPIG